MQIFLQMDKSRVWLHFLPALFSASRLRPELWCFVVVQYVQLCLDSLLHLFFTEKYDNLTRRWITSTTGSLLEFNKPGLWESGNNTEIMASPRLAGPWSESSRQRAVWSELSEWTMTYLHSSLILHPRLEWRKYDYKSRLTINNKMANGTLSLLLLIVMHVCMYVYHVYHWNTSVSKR